MDSLKWLLKLLVIPVMFFIPILIIGYETDKNKVVSTETIELNLEHKGIDLILLKEK